MEETNRIELSPVCHKWAGIRSRLCTLHPTLRYCGMMSRCNLSHPGELVDSTNSQSIDDCVSAARKSDSDVRVLWDSRIPDSWSQENLVGPTCTPLDSRPAKNALTAEFSSGGRVEFRSEIACSAEENTPPGLVHLIRKITIIISPKFYQASVELKHQLCGIYSRMSQWPQVLPIWHLHWILPMKSVWSCVQSISRFCQNRRCTF